MKKTLALILLVIFTSTAPAQYEVSVTSIPVWVKVVDRSGNPVRGLTAAEFELFEDGKRIATDCFEEIDLQEPGQARSTENSRPGTPNPAQKFVLFLDLFNTTPREFASVKPALQAFLDNLAGKNAQVMLAGLMQDKRLGVVTRYTSDLQRVRILLDFARANPRREVQARERVHQMEEALVNPRGANENTNNFDDTIMDAYNVARLIAGQEASISQHTLSALESFSEHLARTNSREHTTLIFVSGGFSSDPGRKFFRMVDALDNRNRSDAAAMIGQSNRQTGFFYQEELRKSVSKLNRMNVTLYTLDTRATETDKEYQDSLVQLAQQTGGLAFYNSANFSGGLERVSQDIQHQYVICYRPPEHKVLGAYHTIRVNVKRTGLTVRHRDGYWE